MITADIIVSKVTILITLGIIAQWFAWRFKIPSIVLLSLTGILVGPVTGWIDPIQDFGKAMNVLIKLAVSIILFEGGLSLKFKELKLAGANVGRLVFLALPISWVLGTASAHYIIGLPISVSAILGAILVITGPTVIIPLLRQTRLTNKMSSLIKWEGILNDPVGVLLTIFLLEWFTFTEHQNMVLYICIAVIAAILVGICAAYLVKYTFNNDIVPDFLKVPVVLCLVVLVYTSSNLVHEESGLLAVTVFGCILANIGLDIIQEVKRFKEDVAVFLISTVFIVITASLDVDHLKAIRNLNIILFFVAILFIVRPVSIWISTIGSNLNWRERLLIGWIAPRGIVAASSAGLFAPLMIEQGLEGSEIVVPIIFSVVLITVSLHGLSLGPVAKLLKLSKDKSNSVLIVGAHIWTVELAKTLKKLGIKVTLADDSSQDLATARKLGIDTFCGEITPDYYEGSQESLDLMSTKYLIAATSNDSYNTLICNTLAKSEYVDFPLHLSTHENTNIGIGVSKGSVAFNEDVRYENLIEKHFTGWKFKELLIEKPLDYNKFKSEFKDVAVPIFLLKEHDKIEFEHSKLSLKPAVGDRLFCFVAPSFKPEFLNNE